MCDINKGAVNWLYYYQLECLVLFKCLQDIKMKALWNFTAFDFRGTNDVDHVVTRNFYEKSMCEDDRTLTTYLNSLLAVQCKAADGFTVPDGGGSGRALQAYSHWRRKLSVQLVGEIPHHAERILQTLKINHGRKRSGCELKCTENEMKSVLVFKLKAFPVCIYLSP